MFGFLHTAVFVGFALRVMSRKLNPGASLAWILLIGAFPFGGAVIYLMIGERSLGRERLARLDALQRPFRSWLGDLLERSPQLGDRLPPIQRPLAHLGAATAKMPLVENGEAQLLEGAQAITRAMIADIDAAQESCDLVFYIWSQGGCADDVAHALLRAAGRGVRCRVLLDGLGSAKFLRSDWVGKLRGGGVDVQTALAVGLLRMLFVRADLRLHRKIVVVDSHIAYTGSMNMVDPRYFKRGAGVGEWIDAMIRFTGPPVRPLHAVFLTNWQVETGLTPKNQKSPRKEGVGVEGAGYCLVVPAGPDLTTDDIRQLFLTLFNEAQSEIVITTPYFVPDEPIMMALKGAALRGVSITLIVPERVDSLLVRYASRSYFDELLSVGVRVLQFRGGLLHTKSVTVDHKLSIFGTVNLDIRSLSLNYEVSALFFSDKTTAAIRALQSDYEKACEPLNNGVWAARPAHEKAIENFARLASPLL